MKYILIIWIIGDAVTFIPTQPRIVATYQLQTDCAAAQQEWIKQKDRNAVYKAACLPVPQ